MNPALFPVIDAVPSVPTTFRVSLNSVPLIALYTSFAMVIPLPSCGETCVKLQAPGSPTTTMCSGAQFYDNICQFMHRFQLVR